MEEVTTKELRDFLMKHLREEEKVSERSCNYYNSVIGFIYDVLLDKLINQKQIPMYKKNELCIVQSSFLGYLVSNKKHKLKITM